MSIRPRHLRVVFATCVIVALAAVVAAAIAVVTTMITGRASPLPAAPPWAWSGTDIAQWFSNRATADSVLDVVTQVFATIAWLALIYVAWNIIRELIDQARHGIIDTRAPRTRQRSSTRRARPAFASSFVALLLGASTITASTVGAIGLPPRAPAVVAVHDITAEPAVVAHPDPAHDTGAATEVAVDSALPAGMRWHDYTATRADESLRSIATDISGDATLARFIWTTNQHREVSPGTAFNDPTIVKQGWTLRIPVPNDRAEPSAPAPPPAVDDTQVPVSHDEQVDRGDTLWDMVDDVVDDPVTMTQIQAVAVENDGVATPDGTFVFSASNPDLIHPEQVFDLQPAIDLDTAADAAFDDGVDEAPEVAPQVDTATVDAPATPDAPTTPDAGMDEAPGGIVVDTPGATGAPDAAGRPDRVRIDDTVVDEPPAAPAPPAPAVVSPAPPMPVPTNAVATPQAQPGDSAATPPPPAAAAIDSTGNQNGIPIMLLAAGGLGLAGLFIALDRRRRIARAKRPLGHAMAAPDPAIERNEQIMRAAARIDRATRVNLTVRQLGAQLAERDAPLRSRYLIADATTVTVVFDHHVELDDAWTDGPVANSWTCAVSDDDLAAFATVASPWPALVPIGTLDDGSDIIVDVEGIGALAVTGPDDAVDAVLSALVMSISSSPYADLLTLVDDSGIRLHGLDAHLQHRLAVDSVDTLVDRLGAWIAPFDFSDQHLIAARHEFGGEYEPCIAAVACDLTVDHRRILAELPFDGSRPIALITTDTDLANTVFVLDADSTTVLDGQQVRCHRLEPAAAAVAARLFDMADTPQISESSPIDEYRTIVAAAPDESDTVATPPTAAVATPPTAAVATAAASAAEVVEDGEPFVSDPSRPLGVVHTADGVPPVPEQLFDTEPDVGWHVRNLGPLEIVHTNGTHLVSMRELFTMLAMHPAGLTGGDVAEKLKRSKPSKTGASSDVDDADDDVKARRARFSDLRRALGHGDPLVGRAYLPVHSKARGYHVEGVRVDSERFIRCLESAKSATGNDKINWLVGGLQLVRGQINTGELTKYGWASHILTTLEANVVDAGIELAQLAADSGNWSVADWAANQVRVANPYDQRGLPFQVQARQALGDEVGIRRLHDEAIDTVDELEPDVHEMFIHALAQ